MTFLTPHLLERFARWLKDWWLVQLLDSVARFAIVATVVTLFLATPRRHAQRIADAWQVLDLAHDIGAGGGRASALATLNDNAVDLSGLAAQHAILSGAALPGAMLRGSRFDSATLKCADMHDANLWRSNLREADLSLADLRGAILDGSDMTKANFFGALLDSASLEGVRLDGATFDSVNVSLIAAAGYDASAALPGRYGERIVQTKKTSSPSVPVLSPAAFSRDAAFSRRFQERLEKARLRTNRWLFWLAPLNPSSAPPGVTPEDARCLQRRPS